MRFIEKGPDIPDELLFAQDEGNVVFFCGAGVSMAHAKLASFSALAEKVINDLGATEDSKAKKLFQKFTELNKEPHTRGVMSADHIFSSLIRSFDRSDINCSVARSLLPTGVPALTAHKTILQLARSQGGHTRLVTTNFDLLFEACNKKLKSVTRSNLPHVQFSDNDWGIVHLHGKVKPDYSAPDRDGFVLSSSEFGDAYLAQGWARNFVKDVLGKFVAVFIGYSADDPPVRYLLEGLQQSNGANHNIFAFQSADDEAIAQWDEKGVTPIVYSLDQEGTHAPLWDTLASWGTRTKNPAVWKNKLLIKARRGPDKLLAYERGMVAHLIKSQSGARAFKQMNPPLPSDWLCVFDPTIRLQQVQDKAYLYPKDEIINPYQLYGLDSDPPPSDRNEEFSQKDKSEVWDAFVVNERDHEDLNNGHLPSIRSFRSSDPAKLPARLNYLAMWIAKVADQQITVWWAGRQSSLHPDLLRYVNNELRLNKEKIVPKSIFESWNAIIELSYFYGREKYQEYELKSRIDSFGWSSFYIREYSKLSAPFLKTGSFYRRSIPRYKRKQLNKYSLVRVDVEYPEGIYDITVPDEFISQILSTMRINLERAVEMEEEFSGCVQDICAIEPDESPRGINTSRGQNLSAYVLHFVSLFRRLSSIDIQEARNEFRRWRKDDPVFTRLRIWAAGIENLIDESEFTTEILSLNDEDFWPFKGERDLLLSLKSKWNGLSENNRKLIENRILKGPPK
ncbi:MAG: SIR2 family protein [Gammaproteobacteria bacterium]|nr:SIR2 family protein [Gammaproteobacteria bacterium]